jgi:dimethylglycine dehydrogenase
MATIPKCGNVARGVQDAYQRLVTPDEVAAMHPLVNMDGILGGLHTTGDGHIDPYSLTMALAKGRLGIAYWVVCALVVPESCFNNPVCSIFICGSLHTGARMHGARIAMPVGVTGLAQRCDGGWDVDTTAGKITARRVVNSAGFWAEEIGRLAGTAIQSNPIRERRWVLLHHYSFQRPCHDRDG